MLTDTERDGARAGHAADEIGQRIGVEVRNIGIPPRPAILAEIDHEMARESPDFRHLSDIIGSDVGLAASVIKVANSPFFGMGKRVRSVTEALLVLGLKITVHTIAGAVLERTFPKVPSLDRFWDSAARVAHLSRWIAQRLHWRGNPNPDDAYTFGLFRDCGIPLLMIPFPEYVDVLKHANAERERCFTAIEDEALAINHASVGSELAEDWLLPDEVVFAIQHHHAAAALGAASAVPSIAQQLIAVAHLAEHLIQANTGLSQTAEWEKLGAASLAVLGLDDADLEALIANARDLAATGA